MALSPRQSQYLRALGHHAQVIVQIGKNGVTDGVTAAVHQALLDDELVKIRVSGESPADRHEAAEALAEALKAEVAQVLGHTLLLYRPHPSEPKLKLPKEPKKA